MFLGTAYGQRVIPRQRSMLRKKEPFLVVLIAISRQAGSLGLTLSMDKADSKLHEINHLATTNTE